MYVILGESGDTDHEELISGTHKTLIIKGLVEKGSEELLRATDLKDDIVPAESPLVTSIKSESLAEEIVNALRQISKTTN